MEIFPDFAEGLRDLQGFSHIYLICHFNRAGAVQLIVKPFLQDIEGFRVTTGTALRIMTGATLPPGATSVLASEFAQVADGLVSSRADARVGQKDWTQLVYGKVHYGNGSLCAVPLNDKRRLEAMAAANALIEIPEGCAAIHENSLAEAWFFNEKSIP